MTHWTLADIPTQTGRSSVVTGTGGIGFETALALARAGGDVILAGRNPAKGADAIAQIRGAVPTAKIRFEELDLASLTSVKAFADRLAGDRTSLDLLVANAGIMMPPTRRTTTDGFELQFGTNHLGHFALAGALLPLLRKGAGPRVVSLSSIAHRGGKIWFDDLQSERSYKPWRSYSQSKLAVLMFALELQRRSDAGGWGLISNAAHPGYARTELVANGPGTAGAKGLAIRALAALFSHPADIGVLPILYAATSPDAKAGGYYGPDGFRELKGWPTSVEIRPQALDHVAAARLWEQSDVLTGRVFPA